MTKANSGETGIRQTNAVGIFPDGASPCGALDMTGNAWEWCSNEYNQNHISKNTVNSNEDRVLRGGSWVSFNSSSLRAALRFSFSADYDYSLVGFRCARS